MPDTKPIRTDGELMASGKTSVESMDQENEPQNAMTEQTRDPASFDDHDVIWARDPVNCPPACWIAGSYLIEKFLAPLLVRSAMRF